MRKKSSTAEQTPEYTFARGSSPRGGLVSTEWGLHWVCPRVWGSSCTSQSIPWDIGMDGVVGALLFLCFCTKKKKINGVLLSGSVFRLVFLSWSKW